MKRIIVITGLFFILFTVFMYMGCASIGTGSSISWSGDFGYKIEGSEENQTVTIVNYRGRGMNKKVVIPAVINGLPVTKIDGMDMKSPSLNILYRYGAFQDEGKKSGGRNYMITSVTIPSSVTTIGFGAFAYNQLTSVTIPSSVTAIGNGAFQNNQLTSVTIPSSVTSIGTGAFQNNKLTSVTIPSSVTTIYLATFKNNRLTSVNIGNSVTIIDSDAFRNNQLTSVIIPDSVTGIGYHTFADNRLTSVIIGNSVTRIYNNAFEKNQLTSVTIPSSVTIIDEGAFANNKLTSVNIPSSVTSIGKEAFANNQLTSITIPSRVTSVGVDAFGNDLPFFGNSNSLSYYQGYGFYEKQNGQWLHNGRALSAPAQLICQKNNNGLIYIARIDGKEAYNFSFGGIMLDDIYLGSGSHNIEVGWVKYDEWRTYYTGTVTFTHMVILESGIYDLTGIPQGDQILFQIRKR